MNTSRLDALILVSTGTNWLKVAMVIIRVCKLLNVETSRIDQEGILIERRIKALILSGHLAGSGKISGWRTSEIRWTSDISEMLLEEPVQIELAKLNELENPK